MINVKYFMILGIVAFISKYMQLFTHLLIGDKNDFESSLSRGNLLSIGYFMMKQLYVSWV